MKANLNRHLHITRLLLKCLKVNFRQYAKLDNWGPQQPSVFNNSIKNYHFEGNIKLQRGEIQTGSNTHFSNTYFNDKIFY